jgi:hypothetical protein
MDSFATGVLREAKPDPTSAALPLRPWANPETVGRHHAPTVVRVFLCGTLVGVGACVPGRSDLVGGLADPAEMRRFARELLRLSAEALGPAETARLDGHAASEGGA